MKISDKIAEEITVLINQSSEPLETKEIELRLSSISRTKIFYRLKELRGDGIIRGKMIGAGKGTWIWWRKDAFVASIIDG
jgi:DNA-binding Lrp family transcriptional regulator